MDSFNPWKTFGFFVVRRANLVIPFKIGDDIRRTSIVYSRPVALGRFCKIRLTLFIFQHWGLQSLCTGVDDVAGPKIALALYCLKSVPPHPLVAWNVFLQGKYSNNLYLNFFVLRIFILCRYANKWGLGSLNSLLGQWRLHDFHKVTHYSIKDCIRWSESRLKLEKNLRHTCDFLAAQCENSCFLACSFRAFSTANWLTR